jgi:hypothetical protein
MNFPQRAPKRTIAQRKADLTFVEHWLVQGYNDRQVTEKLNGDRPYKLSVRQVRYDRIKVETIWKAEMMADMDTMKRRELAELAKAQAEAWAAWEKSKLDAERTTKEMIEGGGDGGRKKASMTKEGQCGDVAYLRILLDIQERRAKILGLDAPARQELSGPAGGPIAVSRSSLTDEQLDAVIARGNLPAPMPDPAQLNDTP